jgi:hypothetical protein
METWRINGGFVDADFLTVGWLEAGRVNSGFVDTYFLTVAWLESGSVLTLSQVDLSIVLWTVTSKVYLDIGASTVGWKLNVDTCTAVSVFGSGGRQAISILKKSV